VRRAMVLEVIKLTAPRIPKGGTTLARAAMARAWAMKDTPAYAREDFEIMRQIAEAAHFTPGLWLLNRLAKLWFDAASEVHFAVKPPADYVASHSKFFDLIEDRKFDEAYTHMADYLDRHDARMGQLLQVLE
jgi:DNA-binding FadR family transcriptional regulator